MKAIFIASGDITWGSARLRCFWPAAHMGSDVIGFDHVRGFDFSGYDAIILQKHGHPDLQAKAIEFGLPVWWDCCDPVWWFSPDQTAEIVDAGLTGIVCSSPGLADDLKAYSGRAAHVIPDRVDLKHYNKRRVHQPVESVRMIWYGVSVNRLTMAGAWANLHRLAAHGYKVELTVMDDEPLMPLGFGHEIPVTMRKWVLEDEVDAISHHDIAILPSYPGPWGRVKSNNKMLTAWATGLPAVTGHDYDELVGLVENHQYRQDVADTQYELLKDRYTVDKSADEWKGLLWP